MTETRSGTAGTARVSGDFFAGTPYREVRSLGSGGMSDVYVVEHRDLEKRFVAKVLREELASDPQTLDRVRIEAQTLGRLSHAHVVSVTDVGTVRGGRPFIVMEYLEGRSVAAEIAARQRIPVREALAYAGELLSALAAVHATGVVHRDVKPSNLFLCDLPNGQRILKMLDFGIARVLPGAPASAPPPLSIPTETGAIVGTPKFMSPEGAMGARVDERADVYGAGLVLYAMLTGSGPFDHLRESDLLMARAERDPERPSRLLMDPLPPELDAAILKALQKEPGARFQSAEEFRRVLEALLHRIGGFTEGPRPSTATTEPDPFRATDLAVPVAGETGPIVPADDVATRTAIDRLAEPPRADEQRAAPALRRLAAACAFLFVAAVAFGIAVWLVRLVRAYLLN